MNCFISHNIIIRREFGVHLMRDLTPCKIVFAFRKEIKTKNNHLQAVIRFGTCLRDLHSEGHFRVVLPFFYAWFYAIEHHGMRHLILIMMAASICKESYSDTAMSSYIDKTFPAP